MENNEITIGTKFIRYYAGTPTSIYEVAKLTKTQIIITSGNNEVRLRQKGNWFRVGADAWSQERYELATPEKLTDFQNQMQRKKLFFEVEKIKFKSLTNEQLEAILKIANDGK